jgi:hypothetical protein
MNHIFYTHINPALLQKRLIYATLFGLLGFIPLFMAAIWAPTEKLQYIGPLLILFWIGVNIPFVKKYTQLRKIDRSPQKLEFGEEGLFFKGMHIPLPDISRFDYIEEGYLYGLAIRKDGKTIFLPYFNKKCCLELQSRLQDIVELD